MQSVGSIGVSLSAIQKEFDATLAAVQWIGLMGSIMLSSLSLGFGRAGDLIGRRTIFKTGLTLYTAGAGLAAIARVSVCHGARLGHGGTYGCGYHSLRAWARSPRARSGPAGGLHRIGQDDWTDNRRGHSSALGLESGVFCQLHFWSRHLYDYVLDL
jgi:MFS family permease